ncbi:MAG: NUDIX hydrolase [Nanoarchaeota archaeon]|nr:NUDIX hydrolase [Nanoarchaeota archaeon]
MRIDLVVAAYIVHDNKVLLIHHKKFDKWIPPGGHIDENEIPDDALKREIKEELNLEIEIMRQNNLPNEGNIERQLANPFYVNVHNVGDHNHCCFFYLCKPKSTEIKIKENEVINYDWFLLEDLKQERVPADVRNIGNMALKLYDSLSGNL